MKQFLFGLLGFALALGVRAETPALLERAIANYTADAERWAYTQRTLGEDDKGKAKTDKLARYDPSQPFEEQWTLLKIDGQEPTERQAKKFRKEQEKRRKDRRSFGEVLILDQAKLIEENETSATFEVPLDKNSNQRLPPEKFVVTARVSKQREAFEVIAIRVRETLRVALVAKVKSGAIDLTFATIDPQYSPTLTTIHAEAQATVMFVKVGGNFDVTRTDFKRVTPYSERFKVKIAPLKFLDF